MKILCFFFNFIWWFLSSSGHLCIYSTLSKTSENIWVLQFAPRKLCIEMSLSLFFMWLKEIFSSAAFPLSIFCEGWRIPFDHSTSTFFNSALTLHSNILVLSVVSRSNSRFPQCWNQLRLWRSVTAVVNGKCMSHPFPPVWMSSWMDSKAPLVLIFP